MEKFLTRMFMIVALSAFASATYASWYGTIRSYSDNTLCMAVKGTVSEGANVQLYKCDDTDPSVHRSWWVSDLDSSVCQSTASGYLCIDYRGGDVDAIVTKKEAWKGNQRWE